MATLAKHTAEERDTRTVQVSAEHTFPVPAADAFAYITAIENWKDYWPDFVRVDDLPGARWSQEGDTVTVVVKLLNREREMHMRLQTYRPDTLVAYLSRQKGLPDAYHERHFRAVSGGFAYRLVVAYVPRPGIAGLFDRSLVRAAVARALNKTIRNLDSAFKQRRTAQWNA
jgi:uncharacterized protein YndB with AHSA1/START domain